MEPPKSPAIHFHPYQTSVSTELTSSTNSFPHQNTHTPPCFATNLLSSPPSPLLFAPSHHYPSYSPLIALSTYLIYPQVKHPANHPLILRFFPHDYPI